MFGIELYYSTVISWCANFFVFSFDLAWGKDPNAFFFNDFLNLSESPAQVGAIQTKIFIGLAVVWFLNWFIVFRGVRGGIELANKIFMPLLMVLTAVLVIWSLTLDGAMEGIKAYLSPDFTKLAQPKVWIDAYSQIFFTLSLGFGIMIAYASYLPEKSDITKGAFLTAFINSGYSLFAGFAVFSTLGYMAATQEQPISEVVTQSIGLAFVAYPTAVSLMPGGEIFGAIFFLCLFVAGMSSSISILEAFTSAVVDKFGMSRKMVVTVTSVIGFLGSIVFATEGGLFWLDIVDHFLTHYGLVVVGVLECVVVGWLFQFDVIKKHVNRVSSIQLGLWWDVLIKGIIPLALSIILIGDLYKEIKAPYEGYSWGSIFAIGVDWVVLTVIVAIVLTMSPWRTGHHKGRSRGTLVELEAEDHEIFKD